MTKRTISSFGAWFREEDYPAIKALSPTDENLPDTFDEWNEMASKQIADMEVQGIPVEKVMVNPHEFAAWCKASGLEPNGATRAAFAVAKGLRQQQGRA